ncbi:MAG: adenosylcobinamide-phosphate synthase CbiB [Cyanobacteria bacterium P01_H01_bin.58]
MPALWCSFAIALPTLAAIADFVIGDPWNWVHPVQVMGWGIQQYQTLVFRSLPSAAGQRLAGVLLGIALPLLSGAIAGGLVVLASQIYVPLGIVVATIILASCLAGRSLRRAAEAVLHPLQQGDLVTARQQLSLYVGRDTEYLSEAEVLRAVMETISENATDGVLAPLFYGLIGSAIAPAWGVGMAIAYKALSTLDSMIGYRTAPYIHLGWFSAKTEDVFTWLPCRLTVLTIALFSGRPQQVLRICQRDAPADPSPNAGWSECAYAATLGVQLGGTNTYKGQVSQKPLLGDCDRLLIPPIIQQGLQLTRWACLLWLALGSFGLGYRYGLNCG